MSEHAEAIDCPTCGNEIHLYEIESGIAGEDKDTFIIDPLAEPELAYICDYCRTRWDVE